MAFKGIVEQKLGKFPHFVIHAILEWILIVLLFLHGFLTFISHEFARLFELNIPCILCTRIDHLLVRRKENSYYNDSICDSHKKDISSLAYCHVHKKLSDIRNMCVPCLLSFATERDSDCDRYKSLMGILHKDIDYLVESDQKLLAKQGKKDEHLDTTVIDSKCSCCGDPLKMKPSVKYTRSPSMSHAPTSSPRVSLLPHIRYTELQPEIVDGDKRKDEIKGVTVPLLPESEDLNLTDDSWRTPTFNRGNRFFGISLSDSAHNSPRFRTPRKSGMDKMEVGPVEGTDMSAITEGDGENMVRNLKTQVHLDGKSLIALYMELDEERSASAIAANNAMAMITRLQAEKAAVQMEALQYQRMMEEQAEYDQEAIQALNDLVLKREEDIKDLESELETYRIRYGLLDEEDYQLPNPSWSLPDLEGSLGMEPEQVAY